MRLYHVISCYIIVISSSPPHPMSIERILPKRRGSCLRPIWQSPPPGNWTCGLLWWGQKPQGVLEAVGFCLSWRTGECGGERVTLTNWHRTVEPWCGFRIIQWFVKARLESQRSLASPVVTLEESHCLSCSWMCSRYPATKLRKKLMLASWRSWSSHWA